MCNVVPLAHTAVSHPRKVFREQILRVLISNRKLAFPFFFPSFLLYLDEKMDVC